MDKELIRKIKKLYKNKKQQGAVRGLRSFYHILIKEKKIPDLTPWPAFLKIFDTWPTYIKFKEQKIETSSMATFCSF